MCDALGGSAMKECPAGSYCVAGEAVACPFESTSRAGSDSVDDCVCNAGLSLVANTTCESVVLDESSVWTPGVIACVVAGCVLVVGLVVGGWWWFTHVRGVDPIRNAHDTSTYSPLNLDILVSDVVTGSSLNNIKK